MKYCLTNNNKSIWKNTEQINGKRYWFCIYIIHWSCNRMGYYLQSSIENEYLVFPLRDAKISLRVRVIVFNATFNNISFISWRRKLPTWQKNALFVWKYQIYVQWIMEKYYTENKRLLWLGHLLCGTNQRQNSSLGWDVNAFLVYRECWPPPFFIK